MQGISEMSLLRLQATVELFKPALDVQLNDSLH